MLKICGNSICRPLELKFNNFLPHGIFPSDWKTSNIVPVHKKSDKQLLKDYRHISLLPICRKILVRTIFIEIFVFFIQNEAIINLVLNQGTTVSINFYQLLTKYTNHLMKVLTFVVYFSTYLGPLIKYGTMVLF